VAYTPLSTTGFKGLRLDADPQDLGLAGAVTLSNVEFDRDGTVRTRVGYDQTDTDTTAGTPLGLINVPISNPEAWLTTSSRNASWQSSAYVYTASNALADLTESMMLWGGDRVIFANTSDLKINTSGVGAPLDVLSADGPRGKFVSFTGFQGGRVACGYAGVGAAAVNNRIHFSNPSDYSNWETDDFVDLGDGADITGMVPWRDSLFVFKTGVFFVFYGTSTDATGGAIFNYREVNAGVGATEYAVCAAQDGVYFVHADGVYRTTGGDPQLVSASLQPFFDQRTNGFFTPTGPLTSPRIFATDDRLYLWQKGATGLFVMDLRTREWTYWVLATAPSAMCALPDSREALFVDSSGRLHKLSPDYTTDDGTAIASHYQTGFVTVSDGSKTRVRGFHLFGDGTVSHSTAVDLGAAGTSASVTLDSPGYDMRSAQGRDVSARLSSTSGAWSVSKWTALVAATRGVR
jgi:hypothetical protein